MKSLGREPPWKSLVRQLRDTGFESPYLDRLRSRLSVEERFAELELELVQEMAAALGRSEAKVDYALLRLELAGRDLDAAADPATRQERLRRFAELREEALRARHDLLIHREAIGMRQNRILEQVYPIPAPRR